MLQQSRIRSRLALSAQETPSAQTLESYVQNTFDDNLCNKRELQWKSHGFVTAALVVLEHSFVALRFPSWLAHSLTFSSPLCSQCPFVRVLFFLLQIYFLKLPEYEMNIVKLHILCYFLNSFQYIQVVGVKPLCAHAPSCLWTKKTSSISG